MGDFSLLFGTLFGGFFTAFWDTFLFVILEEGGERNWGEEASGLSQVATGDAWTWKVLLIPSVLLMLLDQYSSVIHPNQLLVGHQQQPAPTAGGCQPEDSVETGHRQRIPYEKPITVRPPKNDKYGFSPFFRVANSYLEEIFIRDVTIVRGY